MAYDFKREFRDLYQPKTAPALVDVPAMTFAAVAGAGDPNEEGGAYKRALELLYAFSYTVKMSKMGDWQPEGYFDYVVPPLEGLWWGGAGAFDAEAVLAALDAGGAVPSVRLHHEIYLGDPRRTKPERLRTVIRHPVRPR